MRTLMICLAVVAVSVMSYTAINKFSGKSSEPIRTSTIEREIPVPIDTSTLNKEMVTAIETANNEAQDFAKKIIGEWHAATMKKVDEDFLEWYFGYLRVCPGSSRCPA